MFNLHRKEITCFLFVLAALGVEAQVKTRHQPNYDAKPLRFGYYIGFGATHFDVKHRSSFLSAANTADPNGTVLSITSPNTTAIRAGAMINYFVNDYFDIRFSPLNISVQKREVIYVTEDPGNPASRKTVNTEPVDKAWLEIPFHVKYKSERRQNTRMYVFGGTRWAFETNAIGKRNSARSVINASLRTNDLMLEYGVGLEVFRAYFKVTPELHFSHGLFDMTRKNNNLHFLEHVKSLKTHTVSLVILFQ